LNVIYEKFGDKVLAKIKLLDKDVWGLTDLPTHSGYAGCRIGHICIKQKTVGIKTPPLLFYENFL